MGVWLSSLRRDLNEDFCHCYTAAKKKEKKEKKKEKEITYKFYAFILIFTLPVVVLCAILMSPTHDL